MRQTEPMVRERPKHFSFFVGLMMVMQLAGIVGIGNPQINQLINELTFLDNFAQLTPFNLISVFAMFLLFQKEVNQSPFWWLVLTCFLGGIVAELIGVHTGLLFGNYQYDNALGWEIAGVPVLIGVDRISLLR